MSNLINSKTERYKTKTEKKIKILSLLLEDGYGTAKNGSAFKNDTKWCSKDPAEDGSE